jgi:hypothetical protein
MIKPAQEDLQTVLRIHDEQWVFHPNENVNSAIIKAVKFTMAANEPSDEVINLLKEKISSNSDLLYFYKDECCEIIQSLIIKVWEQIK